MNFKQLIYQSALILFIISLTSCGKETDFRSHKKSEEYSTAKKEDGNTINITFIIENKVSIQKALDILEVSLKSKDVSLGIEKGKDGILPNRFLLNEENGQFVKVYSNFDNIEYLDNSNSIHLITINNIQWDVSIHQNAKLWDRAITTLDVSTICPLTCGCKCFDLE